MPPYPTITMRNGDRGDHVRQLQALLNRDYPAYSKLTEDGECGPKTEAVIREFPHRAGLPVTGVADSWTLQKLAELTVQSGAAPRQHPGVSPSVDFTMLSSSPGWSWRPAASQASVDHASAVTGTRNTSWVD